MGSQFYQPSFIPQKSFADDIYKGEQLDLAKENQALKKEQLWEAKSGKAKRITAGWSGHAAGTEAAYKSALEKRAEAKINRDLQGVRDADRTIEELNITAQHSAEWGKQFDATSKEARQNGYKYTEESLDEWDRYEGAQRNAAGVNEDGKFTVDGKVVGENGWNPYQQMPQLVTNREGWLMTSMEKTDPNSFFQGNPSRGKTFNKAAANAHIDALADEGIKNGLITEAERPEYIAAMRRYTYRNSYNNDKGDGGGFSINIGGSDYSGDYDIKPSSEEVRPLPTTGDAPRHQVGDAYDILWNKDKGQPIKVYKFKSGDTRNQNTDAVQVNRLHQDKETGAIYATGLGYSIVDGEYKIEQNREKGQVEFEVTEQNKNQIESLLPLDANGKRLTLDKLFNSKKKEESKASTYSSEQEAKIKANMEANPDYSREEIIEALGY